MMKNRHLIHVIWPKALLTLAVTLIGLGMTATAAAAQSSYITHVVQPEETLGKLAYRYCTTWRVIYNANRDTIGDNPNIIKTGQRLTIEAFCDRGDPNANVAGVDRGPTTYASGVFRAPYYTVAWGDTLFSISQRFNVELSELTEANGISDNLIYAGQTLYIPDGSSPGTPVAEQGPAERVSFAPGAISATRSGVINGGVPKSYILRGSAGQTLSVSTVSHGEALLISVADGRGAALSLTGVNSQIKDNVSAVLPATGDYFVTVVPVLLPENPSLAFDITFTIP